MSEKLQKISIVVPIYNVEMYLKRCVDSVLAQSYKNLDIILVDDGSTDTSGTLCDEYSSMDPRIRVIHKSNGGLSDARNHGIDSAQGEFITFIDSDDWVTPDYIEYLYWLIQENNADISICNFQSTSEYPAKPISNSEDSVSIFSNIEALSELNGVHGTRLVSAWANLYKASLFENIRFPVGKLHEDDFTSYKLLYKANSIVLSTKVVLYYWQRSDSITATRSLKARTDKLEASIERFLFFKHVGDSKLISMGAKSMFHNYLHYDHFICTTEEGNRAVKSRQILNDLRKTDQSLPFKLFYEIYFLLPFAGWLMYKYLIGPLILQPKYREK